MCVSVFEWLFTDWSIRFVVGMFFFVVYTVQLWHEVNVGRKETRENLLL